MGKMHDLPSNGISFVYAPLPLFEKLLERIGLACGEDASEKNMDDRTRSWTPQVALAVPAGTIPMAFWCGLTRS